MPTAPSLDTSVCSDVPRWYRKDFGAVDALSLNTPISLGHTCVTDLCLELFKPSDNYIKPVEGTDYTVDLEAGTVTFLSTSEHTWGQTGHGEEQWTLNAYFNDLECEPEEECKAIECCPPDPYEYKSSEAEDGDCPTASNIDCPEVTVSADCEPGGPLFFPSYMVLSASHPEATIRYTMDGTDPDSSSTLYTVPFQVTDAGVVIKARAFLNDCSPGPILTILYQNPPFTGGLVYNCDTPDKGGTWGVFVPNGTVDNHLQLGFTLTALTTITRLELYQLNANGKWTTGIVWATDSPINPDGGDDFDPLPLLVFEAAVQKWATYQSSLGAFAAAARTWDLYGDRPFPVSGFFKLLMILGDGSHICTIINTTCSGSPVVQCLTPATPTVTGKCDGKVDVTFSGPVTNAYRIMASPGTGVWTAVNSGTINVSPKTVEVTGLLEGQFYEFRVEIDYGGTCSYQSSAKASTSTLSDPFCTISTDKSEVDPGESFNISWTSNFIGGAVCGGCLDGQVSINNGMGCKAGNASGSQAQSQAVAGVYTYQITGCNGCGTAIATVQVTVRAEATCGAIQPNPVRVANPTTLLCGFLDACQCASELYYRTDVITWNGEIWKYPTLCLWLAEAGGGCLSDAGVLALSVRVEFAGSPLNRWELSISADVVNGIGCTVNYWSGFKQYGSTPLGVYTKIATCATGPATITIT